MSHPTDKPRRKRRTKDQIIADNKAGHDATTSVEKPQTDNNTVEDQEVAKRVFGPDIYNRDKHGLLNCVEYAFNEDGSVNWRAMVNPKHLYANKGWFEAKKKAIPSSIEGLSDSQLLISLSGIKALAKLRGFHSVDYDVSHPFENHVTSRCSINWEANYETIGAVRYSECANATSDNTNVFCDKFLETIACNRSFVRCVRNFLNIYIVSEEEIDMSPEKMAEPNDSRSEITPQGTLKKIVNQVYGIDDFEAFKSTVLRPFWVDETYRPKNGGTWGSFDSIPPKSCRELMAIIKTEAKKKL